VTPNEKFNVKSRLRSFGYAGNGVVALVRGQHNAWIHAAATAAVVTAATFFGVSRLDWCLLVLAMALVWAAEALNTAIELLADATVPEEHPLVGRAKDVAAGGVLLCAIGAATVGLLVLWPYAAAWISG